MRFARAAGSLVAALLLFATSAAADIKIGVIYDHTGAFAAGGSKAAAIGNKIAVDMINEKGGVEGHKIIAVEADAQSKTDVAINEAERLLNDVKVDLLMGVYSSAHCVPMAARVDAAKKFMWANVCVASAVFMFPTAKSATAVCVLSMPLLRCAPLPNHCGNRRRARSRRPVIGLRGPRLGLKIRRHHAFGRSRGIRRAP